MSALTSAAEIVRSRSIGASMIASILGISPFRKTWEAWAEMMSVIPPAPETWDMTVGMELQQPIARLVTKKYGIPNEWHDKPAYHPDYPHHRASADALVPTVANPTAILEVKSVGFHLAGHWGRVDDLEIGEDEAVPDYYIPQAMWQMHVLGLNCCYVAALIGHDLRLYRVERDQGLINDMVAEADDFYATHILAGIEPPIEASTRTAQYLRDTFPREKTELVRAATDEEAELLAQYADVRRALEPLEISKDNLETRLKKAVGDGLGIEWAGGRFTWKAYDQRKVDWKQVARRQGRSEEDFLKEFGETKSARRLHFKDYRQEEA